MPNRKKNENESGDMISCNIHPHLKDIQGPQPLLINLPYGAFTFNKIIKVKRPNSNHGIKILLYI